MHPDRIIRQLLRIRLETVPTLPIHPTTGEKLVAWENRHFDPPDPTGKSVLWLTEAFATTSERIVATDVIRMDGLVRYAVRCGAEHGTEALEDLLLAVLNAFQPPTNLTGSGVTVVVERAERGGGLEVDATWWERAVTIFWRSDFFTN